MNNQYDSIIRQFDRPEFPAKYLKGMIEVESGFNPTRTGPQGEVGLLQFLPSTARDRGYTTDQLRDPATAIRAASDYIRWIHDKFVSPHIKVKADPRLRVMLTQLGYNAGIAFAQDAAKRFGTDPTVMGTADSFPQIIDYLRSNPKIAALQKRTGEKDFIGARSRVVSKYQAAAEKYSGDFGGNGSTGTMTLGGVSGPVILGLAAIGAGAWYWSRRKN